MITLRVALALVLAIGIACAAHAQVMPGPGPGEAYYDGQRRAEHEQERYQSYRGPQEEYDMQHEHEELQEGVIERCQAFQSCEP
jgi:hypothetical protein